MGQLNKIMNMAIMDINMDIKPIIIIYSTPNGKKFKIKCTDHNYGKALATIEFKKGKILSNTKIQNKGN